MYCWVDAYAQDRVPRSGRPRSTSSTVEPAGKAGTFPTSSFSSPVPPVRRELPAGALVRSSEWVRSDETLVPRVRARGSSWTMGVVKGKVKWSLKISKWGEGEEDQGHFLIWSATGWQGVRGFSGRRLSYYCPPGLTATRLLHTNGRGSSLVKNAFIIATDNHLSLSSLQWSSTKGARVGLQNKPFGERPHGCVNSNHQQYNFVINHRQPKSKAV